MGRHRAWSIGHRAKKPGGKNVKTVFPYWLLATDYWLLIMIGQLKGQLLQKKPNMLLVDVKGVGYEVNIPLTSFYELPGEGSEITLKIHTHAREDALILFGFCSQREKDLFLKLISISGVGPKLAIAILSELKWRNLPKP